MTITDYAPDEIVRRGEEIYRRDIRPKITGADKGKIVSIDIISGDYEIDADEMAGARRVRARRPDAVVFELRVGYRAADKIGGSWGEEQL